MFSFFLLIFRFIIIFCRVLSSIGSGSILPTWIHIYMLLMQQVVIYNYICGVLLPHVTRSCNKSINCRPTRVGNHPATVLETFGCWPRFWACLNLFDLSDVVNITCIVHYGIEINIQLYDDP